MGDDRRQGWAIEVLGLLALVAAIVLIPGASAAAGGSSHAAVRSAERSAPTSTPPGYQFIP